MTGFKNNLLLLVLISYYKIPRNSFLNRFTIGMKVCLGSMGLLGYLKDWGLIFDENGKLKGMFIPKELTDSPVPQSILHICEEFFGVDLEEENLIKRTLH